MKDTEHEIEIILSKKGDRESSSPLSSTQGWDCTQERGVGRDRVGREEGEYGGSMYGVCNGVGIHVPYGCPPKK